MARWVKHLEHHDAGEWSMMSTSNSIRPGSNDHLSSFTRSCACLEASCDQHGRSPRCITHTYNAANCQPRPQAPYDPCTQASCRQCCRSCTLPAQKDIARGFTMFVIQMSLPGKLAHVMQRKPRKRLAATPSATIRKRSQPCVQHAR